MDNRATLNFIRVAEFDDKGIIDYKLVMQMYNTTLEKRNLSRVTFDFNIHN